MGNEVIVTTSWDDGLQEDLRLAELLQSKAIAGTFYVPVEPYQGRPSLTHAELRMLSEAGFEIGAHSVSHKLLWGMSLDELAKEIDPCKPILEDIVGTDVRMFCYPRGRFDLNTVHAVKKAGYWGARTVRMLSTSSDFDAFEMPTTVQIVPHSRFNYLKNIARSRDVSALRVCFAHFGGLGNWLRLSKSLFDSVLECGGIWHMYGHSHEIDSLGLWHALEEILDYVGKRKEVLYLPNCEVIRRQGAQLGVTRNGKL